MRRGRVWRRLVGCSLFHIFFIYSFFIRLSGTRFKISIVLVFFLNSMKMCQKIFSWKIFQSDRFQNTGVVQVKVTSHLMHARTIYQASRGNNQWIKFLICLLP